ncbi:UNVERIFIED_CONTAM: hypothetical protein O8I53_06350 [Campylobacter lari]
MKKNKFLNLLGLPIITSFLSIAGQCSVKHEIKFRNNNELEINPLYDKLYQNTFFQNKNEKFKDYILEQKALKSEYDKEVLASLIITPIYAPDIPTNSNLARSTKDVLNKALTDNSLWFLENINKFEFIYNPYGDKYSGEETVTPKNIEKTFLNKLQNEEDLVRVVSSLKQEFNISFEQIKGDVYNNKRIYYFVFENKLVLPVITGEYIENNQVKYIVKVLPTLLEFKEINEDIFMQFTKLLNNERNMILKKAFEYEKEIFDNLDENQFYLKFNDKNFFSIFSENNYQKALMNILENKNDQQIILNKYT